MAALSLKEISCYMQPIFPDAFDANTKIEYGDGAIRGASMVFGRQFSKSETSKREIHKLTVDLAGNMPADIASVIAKAVQARLTKLRKACQELRSIAKRSQAKPADVIDALDLNFLIAGVKWKTEYRAQLPCRARDNCSAWTFFFYVIDWIIMTAPTRRSVYG